VAFGRISVTRDTQGNPAHRADVAHFNEAAATWDDNPARRELTEAIAQAIKSVIALQPHWRLLEYGCGTASLSLMLGPDVQEIVAADASPGMVEQVRRKLERFPGIRLTPRVLDLTAGEVPAERYDLVVMAMALHHVEDVPALLVRLSGLLVPGGWLVIADLAAEDGSFHAPMVVPHNGFETDDLARERGSAVHAAPAAVRPVHTFLKNDRPYTVNLWTAQKR
jgi:2-polyprenyl-3-methyl-5-hydroxy-6-metoxy-1,4-benzoquinol methylase